jgi:hypothetical protein
MAWRSAGHPRPGEIEAMTEDFSWWRAQLAGKNPELTDKLPRVGFFRKVDDPVQIRVVDGVMWAWIGRKGAQRAVKADDSFAESTFSFFCRNAISSELYEAVTNQGAHWPETPPDVRGEIGGNLPSDPFERLSIELDAHKERIEAFINEPVTSEEQAAKAGLWSGQVDGIGKELDTLRKAEKRPLDEAVKAVQAKFSPKVDLASTLARRLKDHMSAWVLAKKRKAEAEERERQEAARKAAESLEMPSSEPTQTRAPSKVVTGGVTVRTFKVPVITDIKAAAAFYAGLPNPPRQFVEVIESMAEKNIKGGIDVPGVHLETRERVA